MTAWRKKQLAERKDDFKRRDVTKANRAEVYKKYLYLRDNAEMTKADIARRFGIGYKTLLGIINEHEKP